MMYRYISSPIGQLLLAGDDYGLKFIGFPQGKGQIYPQESWQSSPDCFENAESQLNEYFAGTRTTFNFPMVPTGTSFQVKVLDALLTIPAGETRTYRDIAQQIGNPKAVRAVGAANGRNPLPIVIPCHRVIGTDGSLTGFGGGMESKLFLLKLEGIQVNEAMQKSLF